VIEPSATAVQSSALTEQTVDSQVRESSDLKKSVRPVPTFTLVSDQATDVVVKGIVFLVS